MELKLIRHLWGVEEAWETAFPKIKALGYTGIECAMPGAEQRPGLRKLLDAHDFAYIPQIFTGGQTVDEHIRSFRDNLQAAKAMKPLFINCHGGSDRWSFDESKAFFTAALEIEAAEAVAVAHETHRGRCTYNPWSTRDLLAAFPNLKLCCDFSHWVVVCERLIDSEAAIIRQCAERTLHIHARVGYEEGPQVPDPRAPEYQRHVEAHERWWDTIWEVQQSRGVAVSTLTPEFGPPSYLHTLPHTNMAVVNLWDVCNWQAQRQRDRFARRAATASGARARVGG